MKKEDYWDITNRPSTRTKLEILKGVIYVWLNAWRIQEWASNEWYIIDLFAGRGYYKNGESGSPIIYLEKINERKDLFNKNIKIKLFFVEIDSKNFNLLKKNVEDYININKLNNIIDVNLFNDDCNEIIYNILSKIENSNRNPLFVLIDPTGIKISKNTIEKILNLNNRKDILFNYILEGVRRTMGVFKKAQDGEELNVREVGTIETLSDFFGNDINIKNKDGLEIKDDLEILEYFIGTSFMSKGLEVVACDIGYPNRNDILYYLLFATKRENILKRIASIYKREKNRDKPSLFGPKFYEVLYFKKEYENNS